MTYKGTCRECRFYDDMGEDAGANGLCHRRAPQFNEGQQDGFPRTCLSGFCGDGELAADHPLSSLLTVAQEAYQFLLGLSDYEVPVGIHERLAAAIVACGGSLEDDDDDEREPCKYCNGTGKVHDAMGICDECECPRCDGSAPSPYRDDAKNGPANTLRRNGR